MLKAAVLSALILSAAVHAETGFHPQNLGFGLDWVHDKDTVFAMVREGNFRRVLQLNPTTKEWKWLSADDFPAGASGRVVMKSRDQGIILNLSGGLPHYTTDGWKTVTASTGTGGPNQAVATDAGYAGYNAASRSVTFSADGKEWAASEGGQTFSGQGLIAAWKNKVVVYSGASGMFVSTDGGKKYDIVTIDSGIGSNKPMVAFRLLSADSLQIVTQDAICLSVDGGKKWTSRPIAFNPNRVIFRGTLSMIAASQNSTKLWFTEDGGANWTEKDGPADMQNYGQIAHIGDALYLWPGWKSTDLGSTWTPFFPSWFQSSGSGSAFCMDFAGSFGAIGLTGGKIAYTFDRARSFTVIDTLPGKLDVMAIRILKNNRLLAGDRNGQTFISSDTGRTWTRKLESGFTQNAIKFSVSSDEKVMILTRGGQPSGSWDNGEKWDFLPPAGGSLTQTVKPDGTVIGMANGQIYTAFPDKAGDKLDTIPSDNDPHDIRAVTDDLGYIVTRVSGVAATDNRIYKTENGFKTNALIATLEKLNWGTLGTWGPRLQVVNPDFLVLYAEGKTFHLVSTDGGKTWTKDSLAVHAKYPSSYPSVRRIHYFDPKQRIQALTGQVLYLDAATGTHVSVHRDAARRPTFSAAFEAGGRIRMRGLDETADVTLHDLSGRRVLFRRTHAGAVLEAPVLPRGLYLIKARTRSGSVLMARLFRG